MKCPICKRNIESGVVPHIAKAHHTTLNEAEHIFDRYYGLVKKNNGNWYYRRRK